MLSSNTIRDALWPRDLASNMRAWAILDGARDTHIYGAVDGYRGEKYCLYAGALPWQLQMAAPYLVEMEREHAFTEFVLKQGWGNAWGIFLHSDTTGSSLRKHFRSFLRVQDQAGRKLIFRYYDPRVMRVYLPTCWTEELRTVFGPVNRYILEDEDPMQILDFFFDGSQLRTKTMQIAEARTSSPAGTHTQR